MSNTRQAGYYWVKIKSDSPVNWSACHCLGGDQWVYGGNLIKIPESLFFSEINETRILSPDEKPPKAFHNFTKEECELITFSPDGNTILIPKSYFEREDSNHYMPELLPKDKCQ